MTSAGTLGSLATMVQTKRLDRARGCLLGLAVGDALGSPLEGLDIQQIRHYYRLVEDYVDGSQAWRKKPYRWRVPGLYSDDTQQALVLAQVLLDCGKMEPERVARYYLELAEPEGSFLGSHRGAGRTFRRVLASLRQGVSPLDCGQASPGIGAAMRIAPLAIYYQDHLDDLFTAVLQASLITHRDCRSLAGALAVSLAVRRMLLGGEREPSFALKLAADVARAENRLVDACQGKLTAFSRFLHSLSKSIGHVESLLELPRDQALAALIDEANCHGPEPQCKKATLGFPPACIPTCIYLFLTTETFEEAIVDVVNLGGDTDTAGAILGAIAGAHYGKKGIPARWMSGLCNRQGIDQRAVALAIGSLEGMEIPDLIETERELTDLENSLREHLLIDGQSGGDMGANKLL